MKTAATVALAVVGTVAVAGVGYGGYQALNDEGPYAEVVKVCLLYTSPSPRDLSTSRMPSSA